jgi:hypothetical protein
MGLVLVMVSHQLHRHRLVQRVFEKDFEFAHSCRTLLDVECQTHLVEGKLVSRGLAVCGETLGDLS